VVDDEEHVRELKLPPNVVHAEPGKSLVSMMQSGEIQAGFTSRAGIGRQGAPKAGWEQNAQPAVVDDYHDLIPNAAPLEAEWYKRTGIYPIHGVLVVKEKLLKDNPWLAKSLYAAFSEAKARYLARLRSDAADDAEDKRYRKLAAVVGDDPLPFGVKPNLPTLEALIKYSSEQKLLPRRVTVDELFVDPAAA
jgi:4,5-dihydroxyphthalate decarboxylase